MNCIICGDEIQGEPPLHLRAYDDDDNVIGDICSCDKEECIQSFVFEYCDPFLDDDADVSVKYDDPS